MAATAFDQVQSGSIRSAIAQQRIRKNNRSWCTQPTASTSATGPFCGAERLAKLALMRLERVKGIEPSYSAWKGVENRIFSKPVRTKRPKPAYWYSTAFPACPNGGGPSACVDPGIHRKP
jgi:hypothetical protein